MSIIAIVEARMTSSRLPGKVLLPACGKPMLALQVERLKQVKQLDDIVIATTTNKADDAIVDLAKTMNIGYFRGSEDDVLARVLLAAKLFKSDVIVEILGDCPAIDPVLVSQCIDTYLNLEVDYVSNALQRTFPGGMVANVFSTEVLNEVEETTREDKVAREHVSIAIYSQPDKYKLFNVAAPDHLRRPDLIIELDEQRDYQLIKKIFENIYPIKQNFDVHDIIKFLDENPKIKRLNSNVVRKWK